MNHEDRLQPCSGLALRADLSRHLTSDTTPAALRYNRTSPKITSGQVSEGHACDLVRDERLARVEAALLVAPGPMTTRKVAKVAMLSGHAEAAEMIDLLNAHYDSSASPVRIERVASGYQLLTRPELSRWLDRVHHRQQGLVLSAPALETLTIIAYRQPMTRVAIESIRGVQSSEMLKQLMERGLIRIVGTEETLGRPFLYGTTKLFLEQFGLRSLNDLPDVEGIASEAPRKSVA